jgi:hypothetical protein
VLHIMGLGVPTDMDGRVLQDLFVDGYMDVFPQKTLAAAGEGDSAGVDYTEEGQKEIVERLRGLGYMG